MATVQGMKRKDILLMRGYLFEEDGTTLGRRATYAQTMHGDQNKVPNTPACPCYSPWSPDYEFRKAVKRLGALSELLCKELLLWNNCGPWLGMGLYVSTKDTKHKRDCLFFCISCSFINWKKNPQTWMIHDFQKKGIWKFHVSLMFPI